MAPERNNQPGPPEYQPEPYEQGIVDEFLALEKLTSSWHEIVTIINEELRSDRESLRPDTIKIMEQSQAIAEAFINKKLIPRMVKVQQDMILFGVNRPIRHGRPEDDIRPADQPPPDPPSTQEPPEDGGQ